MKKSVAFFAAVALLSSLSALAGPPKTDKKKAVKPVKSVKAAKTVKKADASKSATIADVWTCPMTGEAVADKSAKSEVVGNYRVHFCCGGCPDAFAKLSASDKLAKAEEASKKDAAKKG